MADDYEQLLDAAILHLEDLSARGQSHVAVSAETLAALAQAPARSTISSELAAAPAAPARVITPSSPASAAKSEPRPKAAPIAAIKPLGLDLGMEPKPPVPALAPEAKFQAMSELRERALVCVKCPHLASSRKNVVFGVGNIESPLMFVGEAPGADEDAQGEPFVGKAGQLLTKIIQAMGLTRESVYIANILKCRPDTPGQSAGNRKPTTDEMQTCLPYLHAQIDLIQPKVLVALGGTAVEGLLGKTIGIMKLRGNWQAYRGTPLMPTYHPAYLLRNQSLDEKRRIWEDMLQVMEKLEMPISEKQQGFFLK